jgi:hypothetical protein
MKPHSSLEFLNLALKTDKRQAKDRVKSIMLDYCFFYISKNLPTIIRQERAQLTKLEPNLLFSLASNFFEHIVDCKTDLELVLQFTAQSCLQSNNIGALFELTNETIQNCSNVDTQRIPKIKEISKLDP